MTPPPLSPFVVGSDSFQLMILVISHMIFKRAESL